MSTKHVLDKAIKNIANDAKACDVSEFGLVYNRFMKEMSKIESMDPKVAEKYINSTAIKYLDMLNDEFNKISREKSDYYEKIRDYASKASVSAYQRYRKENSK